MQALWSANVIKKEKCYYCHEKGHIAMKCRAKSRAKNVNKQGEDQRASNSSKYRQTTEYLDKDQEVLETFTLFTLIPIG